MIVYVESNFILELVLKQEQAGAVEAILQLAENGKIELNSYNCRYERYFGKGLSFIRSGI